MRNDSKVIHNNRKRMISDMILNISAAAIPVAMLQLFIFPLLGRRLLDDEYGLMITIYSLWSMISNTLGNVIFNVRLIKNSEYEDNSVEGDFLVILSHYYIANIIIIAFMTAYYNGGFALISVFLSIIASSLLFLKAYLDVGFRLIINFKYVTISGGLVGLGFVIGCFIAIYTNLWEMVFITGYLFGCVFAILKTNLLSEKRIKTPLYNQTIKDCLKLTGASIIATMMTYADKLVLFPIMGGHYTAIYYNATLLSKIVGMVTGPASGVILTYLSKKKNASNNSFNKMLFIGLIIVTICYFIVLIVYRPIMTILYPSWVDEIMHYIPFTTMNVSLLALISMLNPYVLKFCDLKWQMFINGNGVIIYFVAALLLWHFLYYYS